MQPKNPQFKLVEEEVVLNNSSWFWVSNSATHISFKKGKASFWILLDSETSGNGDYLSTHKRRFGAKRGNSFFLPDFKLSVGSGYSYGPVCWVWRCRKCNKKMLTQALLDFREVCLRCNHA